MRPVGRRCPATTARRSLKTPKIASDSWDLRIDQSQTKCKMERKHILLILLICSLNVEGVRKKKHPGCAIWWFFPGCPLAKIFGPDPFNIYPWKKFCKKYSSIETSDFCDAKKEAVEEVSVQPQVEEAQSRSEEPVFRRPRNPFKRLQKADFVIDNTIFKFFLISF